MFARKILNLCISVAENGDKQSFRQLFDIFSPGLFAYVRSIIHDSDASKDIVADIFINIWKNKNELRAINSLPYYLYAAAKNRAFNFLRNKKGNVSIHNLSVEMLTDDIAVSYNNPENERISSENLNIIISAIDALPPKCRLIFKLSKEDAMTYKEIALLLNISVKTVESHMNAAFRKIFEHIRSRAPEFAYLVKEKFRK